MQQSFPYNVANFSSYGFPGIQIGDIYYVHSHIVYAVAMKKNPATSWPVAIFMHDFSTLAHSIKKKKT